MKGLLRDHFYAAYANGKSLVRILFVAGIAIVAVIFIEKAFKEFVKSPCCTKKCTD